MTSELALASIIAAFSSTFMPIKLSGFFELHALSRSVTNKVAIVDLAWMLIASTRLPRDS